MNGHQTRAALPFVAGLPLSLKAGIEQLSGYSMEAVRVHYHSPYPAVYRALAYTQGLDIYLASGQERCLPHEAWHVVQQAQGRVHSTAAARGVNLNTESALEREADMMGKLALQMKYPMRPTQRLRRIKPGEARIIQRCAGWQELYDKHWIWPKLIDGCRWYKEDNGVCYYILESAPSFTETYKKNQKIRKTKVEWDSLTDIISPWVANHADHESDPEVKVNETPCLGMEIELIENSLSFKTNCACKEEEIKAIPLCAIAGDRVNVTFDSRSTFDEEWPEQSLVIELIFDAKKFPLSLSDSDFTELGNVIIADIKALKYSDLKKNATVASKVKVQIGKGTVYQNLMDIDNAKLVFPDLTGISVNIHITCAMSLEHLGQLLKSGKLDLGFVQVIIQNSAEFTVLYRQIKRQFICPKAVAIEFSGGYQYPCTLTESLCNTDDARCLMKNPSLAFIFLIINLCLGANGNHNDPKSAMTIMNRTSFGKMVTMLNSEAQGFVIEWMTQQAIENKSWYFTDKHRITYQNMLDFFTLCQTTPAQSSLDPTYHANRDIDAEKLGISQLGDKTEKDIKGNICPLFEFRVGAPTSISKLEDIPTYLATVGNTLKSGGDRQSMLSKDKEGEK
jgi:hypothetical protein